MFVCKAHLSGGQTEFSLALDALMLHNAQCTCKISQSIRRPHATSVSVWERSLANTSTAAANDFSRILSSPSYLLHGVVSCFCITRWHYEETQTKALELCSQCVCVCVFVVCISTRTFLCKCSVQLSLPQRSHTSALEIQVSVANKTHSSW